MGVSLAEGSQPQRSARIAAARSSAIAAAQGDRSWSDGLRTSIEMGTPIQAVRPPLADWRAKLRRNDPITTPAESRGPLCTPALNLLNDSPLSSELEFFEPITEDPSDPSLGSCSTVQDCRVGIALTTVAGSARTCPQASPAIESSHRQPQQA